MFSKTQVYAEITDSLRSAKSQSETSYLLENKRQNKTKRKIDLDCFALMYQMVHNTDTEYTTGCNDGSIAVKNVAYHK